MFVSINKDVDSTEDGDEMERRNSTPSENDNEEDDEDFNEDDEVEHRHNTKQV
jgi:hypothetical protein